MGHAVGPDKNGEALALGAEDALILDRDGGVINAGRDARAKG